MKQLVVFLFALLITASLMWPSEGAINGDGLHLAIGWLLAAALATVAASRGALGSFGMQQVGVLRTVSVALLVGGIWLSTWRVFQIGGDRRSALNLAFEWSAIGAAWWMTVLLLRGANGRQWIVTILIGLSVGVSVVGIVQYHITHQRQAEWYQQQKARLKGAAVADGAIVSQEFSRLGIPLDGPSQKLFEMRLLASSEPTGPFALANSLGGILAVGLVLLVGGCWQSIRQQKRLSILVWSTLLVGFLAMAYCLILTKSRTAWVGLVCGLAILFLWSRAVLSPLGVKRLTLGIIASFVLAVVVGIGSGAIDKEVVLESPRSLQFRLFYWMGAAGVIAEEPVFGSGPGNFRPVYLKHKVPESSEEILDPHNIILDAWCTAGMAGLVAVCMLAFKVLTPTSVDFSEAAADTMVPNQNRRMVLFGIVSGLLTHLSWRWLNGGEFFDLSTDIFDAANVVVAIPVAAFSVLWVAVGKLVFSADVVRAAFVCLFVHLLGAGGLHISALGLVLLMLHALSVPQGFAETGKAAAGSPRSLTGGVAGALVALSAATAWYGLLPVRAAATEIQMAAILQAQGKHHRAVTACDRAILADFYGTKSRQRKMQLLSYMFVTAVGQHARQEVAGDASFSDLMQLFERAIAACDDVIAADQRSYMGYHFRSRLRAEIQTLDGDKAFRESALNDMTHVLDCYPGNSVFWYEYAKMLKDYERSDEAEAAASRALEIDALNYTWGHTDRYLSEERVGVMRQIAGAK